jgi:hypothetical protein
MSMSTSQAAPPARPDYAASGSTSWRVAGGLAIAQVVLMMAAITQEVLVEHGDSADHIKDAYGNANLTRVFGAGYVEALSFLVMTPAIVFMARALGRRTAVSQWAGQTFLALGIAYVASTLAVGFAPAAAAIYGVQHGADPASVAMVNDLRNFGFTLQIALTLGMSIALGVAALAERTFVRWVGWGGIAVGAVGLVALPFSNNTVSLVWLVWWVGVAVLFLRGEPQRS